MKKIRIAGAQIPVWDENIEYNKKEIFKALDWAKENEVDELLTPECALSGYKPSWVDRIAELVEALKEVDLALELNPDLALAYARRGSIYYKLGDVQRATINWNLALRLDPEYDDVRNILKALNENRLKEVNLFEE